MTYRVLIALPALEVIREQAHYLAVEQQAPAAAERWLQRVQDAAKTLVRFPHRCALAPENRYRPYEIRWLGVDRFMLLFAIEEASKRVWILSARHGHQLPKLADLPDDRPDIPKKEG